MQHDVELYVIDEETGAYGLGVEVLPEGSAPSNTFGTVGCFGSTTCPSTFSSASSAACLSSDMKA